MATIREFIGRFNRGWQRLDHGQERKRQLWLALLQKAINSGTDSGDWKLLRAPGRVNLIGEHMDYNGLPVMPMAIDREVLAVFRPLEGGFVRLNSLDETFGPREFEVSASIPPYPAGDWGNYAKAAVEALCRVSAERGLPCAKGFEAWVAGDIPPGAGLSSSSALVVAMSLMMNDANGLGISKMELADITAWGERYVGTQGGGMDQTACLMSRAGKALQIEFNPTRPTPRPLPPGTGVVIANTLVRAEKSGGAREAFNRRSTECRMAAALMAARIDPEIKLLHDVYVKNPADPVSVLDSVMDDRGFSIDDLADALGASVDDIRERFLKQRDGSYLPEPDEGFLPYRRARHVLSEAVRVWAAAEAMEAGDAVRMGEMMNLSHVSCRDDFDNSCPELEALVGSMRQAGAIGARLTGAGWGGCAVALVRSGSEQEVMDFIGRAYYNGWLKENRPQWAASGPEMFSTLPQSGAEVIDGLD